MKKIEYIKRETGKWECRISDEEQESHWFPVDPMWALIGDLTFDLCKERLVKKEGENESKQE